MTTAPTAADHALCLELLPAVSRTFALSIELLPDPLRTSVRVAYLMCRIVDTIEDDPTLGQARDQLFNLFDQVLLDDWAPVIPLERAADRLQAGVNKAERTLMTQAGSVFRVFRSLPAAQRDAIRPHVLEMSAGMHAYSLRAARCGHMRLRDVADLEHYCDHVAGTVGRLLTALFRLCVPEQVATAELAELASQFGIGLQLVNIVKDAGRDAERGTSFIPQQVLTRHGADPDSLLGADQREAGLRAVEEICDLASAYLAAANRYTLSWPEDGVGRDIRLFCTVPLLLAHATLRTVRVHPNTLAPGGTPKVGREDVMRALDEAVRAASDTSALDALLVRWAA